MATYRLMFSLSLHTPNKEWKLGYNAKLLKQSKDTTVGKISVPLLEADPKISRVQRKEVKERIREHFSNVEVSASAYDTAWVAMVPSLSSLRHPCFPECVDWLLENQLPDGSWGLPHHRPYLLKDALSSTLACVLALRTWNIGEEHIARGLCFVGSNFESATDEKKHSPLGFDIIFPGLIEYAEYMGLNLPLKQVSIDAMLQKRDMELQRNRSKGRKMYLAYVAEGLGKKQDWEEVMKYQRKNGSLFNSPSTTAAALIHLKDAKCLEYLCLLLKHFGGAVPTIYPLDKYIKLHMVDNLEKLGIARHFSNEIEGILDEIYRCWLQNDEEILMDISICALSFRHLLMNGYDVSSDPLTKFAEEVSSIDLFESPIKDLGAILDLYKASEMMMGLNEQLEKLNYQCKSYLQKELSMNENYPFSKSIVQEVDYALKFPYYANLERLQHRRDIELCDVLDYKIFKTVQCSCYFANKDLLELAVEDFNICQAIHRGELELLDRWVKENRLNELKFARQKSTYCYFSAAATLFSPELSDARMSWAKNGVLTTVVDDFCDVGGSREELLNLMQLIERWDGNSANDFSSEQVQIIFSAIYNTINELDMKAYAWQGRSIRHHLIEIWLDLLKSMMREAEWQLEKSVQTLDEYMLNAYISFALGPIVLPALYFVGPKLSDEVIGGPECHYLFKLMSTCGRLLNDMQGFKREGTEGKLNGVSLRIAHGNGSITEERALQEMRSLVESSRNELLRVVLERESSVFPKDCKDLFWKMTRILHLFYMNNDGFTSPQEMLSAVNAVIHEPLTLLPSLVEEKEIINNSDVDDKSL